MFVYMPQTIHKQWQAPGRKMIIQLHIGDLTVEENFVARQSTPGLYPDDNQKWERVSTEGFLLRSCAPTSRCIAWGATQEVRPQTQEGHSGPDL